MVSVSFHELAFGVKEGRIVNQEKIW